MEKNTLHKNPWLDIASYSINDANRFKGREKAIVKFSGIVNSGIMSVLYASSGIGKTSFLNAGIDPLMIQQGYIPIHILFPDEIFSSDYDIEKWLIENIKAQSQTDGREWKSILNLTEEEQNGTKDILDKCSTSLWWMLHTCSLGDGEGKQHFPLLVFDQFEEVFVKARKFGNTKLETTLFQLIEELSNSSLPLSLGDIPDKLADQDIFLNINHTADYKVIFSLRKEYLSDFDYWTQDRFSIAELQQNRMLLLPLTRKQALRVITEQPDPSNSGLHITTLNLVKDEIINKLDAKQNNIIEPFLLSVLCSRLYDMALQFGQNQVHNEDFQRQTLEDILRSFYEDKTSPIISKYKKLRLEQFLVDEDGCRNRKKAKELYKVGITPLDIELLENVHIIRKDKYNSDEDYVELIHDKIAEVIQNKRNVRDKKYHIIAKWATAFILLGIIFFLTYWNQMWTRSQFIYNHSDTLHIENRVPLHLTIDSFRDAKSEEQTAYSISYIPNLTSISIHHRKDVNISHCPLLERIYINDIPQLGNLIIHDCPNMRALILSDSISKISLLEITNCNNLKSVRLPLKLQFISRINIYPRYVSFVVPHENENFDWEQNALWLWGQVWYVNAKAARQLSPPDGYYNQSTETYTPRQETYRITHKKVNDSIALKVGRKEYKFSRNAQTIDLSHIDSLSYIPDEKFANLKELKEVILPNNLYSIGDKAFYGCNELCKCGIPQTVSIVRSQAFEGTALEKVCLPRSMNTLGDRAFANCNKLEYVALPTTVSMMGENVFVSSHNLRCVVWDESHWYQDEDGTILYDSVPYIFNFAHEGHTLQCGEYHSRHGYLYKGDHVIHMPTKLAKRRREALSREYNSFETLTYIENGEVYFYSYPAYYSQSRQCFAPIYCDNIKKLHWPFTYNVSSVNGLEELLRTLPKEQKDSLTIVFPHGHLKYWVASPIYNNYFIEEESLWESLTHLIKYYYYVGWRNILWYNLRSVLGLIVLLFIICVIGVYYYRMQKRHLPTNFILLFWRLFFMTIVAVGIWYILYWAIFFELHLLVTSFPIDMIITNIIAIPLDIFIVSKLFSDFSINSSQLTSTQHKAIYIFTFIIISVPLAWTLSHHYSTQKEKKEEKRNQIIENAIYKTEALLERQDTIATLQNLSEMVNLYYSIEITKEDQHKISDFLYTFTLRKLKIWEELLTKKGKKCGDSSIILNCSYVDDTAGYYIKRKYDYTRKEDRFLVIHIPTDDTIYIDTDNCNRRSRPNFVNSTLIFWGYEKNKNTLYFQNIHDKKDMHISNVKIYSANPCIKEIAITTDCHNIHYYTYDCDSIYLAETIFIQDSICSMRYNYTGDKFLVTTPKELISFSKCNMINYAQENCISLPDDETSSYITAWYCDSANSIISILDDTTTHIRYYQGTQYMDYILPIKHTNPNYYSFGKEKIVYKDRHLIYVMTESQQFDTVNINLPYHSHYVRFAPNQDLIIESYGDVYRLPIPYTLSEMQKRINYILDDLIKH